MTSDFKVDFERMTIGEGSSMTWDLGKYQITYDVAESEIKWPSGRQISRDRLTRTNTEIS